MSDRSFTTTTVVSVTVEVQAGSYGPEWKIEDIRKQASQEAVIAVENALRRDPMKSASQMRVQKSSTVRVIITEGQQ